jgi:DNA polymerase-3 subunit epsilon
VAALDIETTGLGKYGDDSLVQLGLVAVAPSGNRVGKSLVTLVKPTTPIRPTAQAVHGISKERAQAEGREPKEVLEELADKLDQAYTNGFPLVIHNALFDWPVLCTEFARHGVPVPATRILDTYLLASVAKRRPAPGLALLVQDYRVGIQSGDHDAGHDAQLCGALLFALLEKHQWLKKDNADLYLAEQIKWNQQYPHRGTHPDELWPAGMWSQNIVARQLEFVPDWARLTRHEQPPKGYTLPDRDEGGETDSE